MPVTLNKEQMANAIPSVQTFIEDELGQEIGELKARFLVEFFMKELGPIAYNQGVEDAETFFRSKLEDLKGCCFAE